MVNSVKNHFVYVVECSDGSLYTGYSNNVEKRIETHNSGKGAKCLRGKLPVKLVFKEEHKDHKSALQKERSIKKLTRKQKEELIKNHG